MPSCRTPRSPPAEPHANPCLLPPRNAEEEANAYFQRVYAGEITVEALVEVRSHPICPAHCSRPAGALPHYVCLAAPWLPALTSFRCK